MDEQIRIKHYQRVQDLVLSSLTQATFDINEARKEYVEGKTDSDLLLPITDAKSHVESAGHLLSGAEVYAGPDEREAIIILKNRRETLLLEIEGIVTDSSQLMGVPA